MEAAEIEGIFDRLYDCINFIIFIGFLFPSITL